MKITRFFSNLCSHGVVLAAILCLVVAMPVAAQDSDGVGEVTETGVERTSTFSDSSDAEDAAQEAALEDGAQETGFQNAAQEAIAENLAEAAADSGFSRSDIDSMRADGMGWGEIAHEIGVHPGTIGLGNKFGHFDRETDKAAHGQGYGHGKKGSMMSSTARDMQTGGAKGLGRSKADRGGPGPGHGGGPGNAGRGKGQGGGNGGGNANGSGNGGGNAGGSGNGGGNAGGSGNGGGRP